MFPRWLSLLFLVFMGVMLVQNGRGAREAHNTTPAAKQERSYPEISKFTDAERWKKAINPDYAKQMEACAPVPTAEGTLGMKMSVDALGEGNALGCLDAADFTITRWDNKGVVAVKKELHLTLGQTGVTGLDAALLEMKPGAARTLVIPAGAAQKTSPLYPLLLANQLNVVSFVRAADES